MIKLTCLVALFLVHYVQSNGEPVTPSMAKSNTLNLVDLPEDLDLEPQDSSNVPTSIAILFATQKLHRPQGNRFGVSGESFYVPSSFKRYSSQTTSAFVPWAGKRSGQSPSFLPFEGKRFQAWAGKRSGTFRNWGGKRDQEVDV